MEWTELIVRTTTAGAEVVSGIFMEQNINGVAIEDKADIAINQRPEGRWDMIDEAILERMEDAVKVRAYIPSGPAAADIIAAVRARLSGLDRHNIGFDMGEMSLSIESVDEEDWAASWKSQFVPLRLGEHLVVKPTWCEFSPAAGDKIIDIDPGMAFGTGTHETTAMCVELVERYVKPGQDVIDIGTGSGILAIAAALMGAGSVLATDIDSLAVRVARENVELNGMRELIEVREGDLLSGMTETADVIIANIIADVIVDIAAPVYAHVRPGGTFICSGISENRLDEVLEALEGAGYISARISRMGEWAAVAARTVEP